jgi:DNA-3-methyladenine glycosylase
MPRWLSRGWFSRHPVVCARELIGVELAWRGCSGIVVETEAYCAEGDRACHTFRRPSAREFVERHRAGAAYVYLNYGMYWLLNVLVKGPEGDGFVLLRAIEPSGGMEEMLRRRVSGRPVTKLRPEALCSGPGKLAMALGVTGADHGRDLCLGEGIGFHGGRIEVETHADGRIGISEARELPWRFTLRGSRFVSVPAKPSLEMPKAGPR